jgi:hypothetical protein
MWEHNTCLKEIKLWFEMSLINVLDDVERYPNLKEKVGSSIPNYETSSLLDKILVGGRLPFILWC